MGCSSDSLQHHRKHSATGVLFYPSRDTAGGFFGRVTKGATSFLRFSGPFLLAKGGGGVISGGSLTKQVSETARR